MSDLKPHKRTTNSSTSFLGFNDSPARTTKTSGTMKKISKASKRSKDNEPTQNLNDLAGFLDVLVRIDLERSRKHH